MDYLFNKEKNNMSDKFIEFDKDNFKCEKSRKLVSKYTDTENELNISAENVFGLNFSPLKINNEIKDTQKIITNSSDYMKLDELKRMIIEKDEIINRLNIDLFKSKETCYELEDKVDILAIQAIKYEKTKKIYEIDLKCAKEEILLLENKIELLKQRTNSSLNENIYNSNSLFSTNKKLNEELNESKNIIEQLENELAMTKIENQHFKSRILDLTNENFNLNLKYHHFFNQVNKFNKDLLNKTINSSSFLSELDKIESNYSRLDDEQISLVELSLISSNPSSDQTKTYIKSIKKRRLDFSNISSSIPNEGDFETNNNELSQNITTLTEEDKFENTVSSNNTIVYSLDIFSIDSDVFYDNNKKSTNDALNKTINKYTNKFDETLLENSNKKKQKTIKKKQKQ